MATVDLSAAHARARDIRNLYEILERRQNGQVWTTNELMLGFANDVGTIGRLILAHDGIWDIDGDPEHELEHKLAETIWWCFVLADRLGVDLDDGYARTMDRIEAGLKPSVAEPES